MSDTFITQFGGTGAQVGRRQGGDIVGPNGGVPIACTQDNMIWIGSIPQGHPQFFFDGTYVRAGSDQGQVVFNIRDNGPFISIGDGVGQSHFLSTTEKGDKMALAATACAWLGDMRLRNPYADVVDGSLYADRINGPAYRDNYEHRDTRGHSNVPWADRKVPDDLISKFGKDNFSPETSKRLIQSRTPASASNRYAWCGDSAHYQRVEALKEAEEIAIKAGLDKFKFDGKTFDCGDPVFDDDEFQEIFWSEFFENNKLASSNPQKPETFCESAIFYALCYFVVALVVCACMYFFG